MFLNDSHIKRDWLDVDSERQQPSMKNGENNTAGLYCITIKDFGPRACHYLSTSIYVQMASNLLLQPPPTGCLCVEMLALYGLAFALKLFKQIRTIPL